MRVFADTKLLVSAVATRGLCSDVVQICLIEHELVLGATVLEELHQVLIGKLRSPRGTANDLRAFLEREADIVHSASPVSVDLRDPSDLPILAEATTGRADVLVTGDRDLLEKASAAPLVVLSPREFWEELRSG